MSDADAPPPVTLREAVRVRDLLANPKPGHALTPTGRRVVAAFDWLLEERQRLEHETRTQRDRLYRAGEIEDRARIVVLERDDATSPLELGAWHELADLLRGPLP